MTSRNNLAVVIAIACTTLVGCQQQQRAPRATLTADALSTSNGIADNGIADNGIADNGIADNGIADNGIADNGIADNGIADNGIADNGIADNGIADNGIADNGIADNGNQAPLANGMRPGDGTNGLFEHGLTADALAAPEFQSWFAIDPVYSDMVMQYFVKCAVADGASLGYSYAGVDYAWPGVFGLAPAWASGQTIPEDEQQLISACLGAHVNGLGQHVKISVRGHETSGDLIPVTADEVATWHSAEACFFGNLFTGPGVYSALMPDLLDASISTPRGCAAEFGQPGQCPPMVQVGMCSDVCTADENGIWQDCSPDGGATHYRPVQTFLRDADIYHCGDGVCDSITENETTCPADCAPAPTPPADPPPADPSGTP